MRPYWRARYVLTKYDPTLPRVTIVTALFNNEKFIGDVIRSARAQSWANIQHVVVDDGSTDASRDVVTKFFMDETKRALRGKRPAVSVELIRQKNAGPGAARNLGVANADDSDYLLFLDSDDILPIHAVRRLVKQAIATGSSMVIGPTQRIDGVRRFDRREVAMVYRTKRERITVNDEPNILSDGNVSGKLFRYDFWRRENLQFPVGVVFEDVRLIIEGYLHSDSIDIITEPVYLWRVRAEGQSITQRRAQLKTLGDRLGAIESNVAQVRAAIASRRCNSHMLEVYLARVISLDLQLYVPALRTADDAYFDAYQKGVRKLLGDAPESVWKAATGRYRDVVRTVVADDRSGVLSALQRAGL